MGVIARLAKAARACQHLKIEPCHARAGDDPEVIEQGMKALEELAIKIVRSDPKPPLSTLTLGNLGDSTVGVQILDALHSSDINTLKKIDFTVNKAWFEDVTCVDIFIVILPR